MMRKVAFLSLLEPENGVLDVCSVLTPLVEPVRSGIFLDLNGCGTQDELLNRLAEGLQACGRSQACIGFGGSRITAVMASGWPVFKADPLFCSARTIRGLTVAEVDAGREREFLGHFRVEDFPLLKKTEARRLKRAGFIRVEELQDMHARQLASLIGRKDLFELERGLNARDDETILGLYPPERLYYRQSQEYEISDRQVLQQCLQKAAERLGRLLDERHVTARRLFLCLQTSRGCLQAQRLLQHGCSGAGRLEFLLAALLEQLDLIDGVGSMDICLDALETVRFEQVDLFSAKKRLESDGREIVIADSLEKLIERFPEAISRGVELDRREQILSFWDPWRYASILPLDQGTEEVKGRGSYEQVLPESAVDGLLPGQGDAFENQV